MAHGRPQGPSLLHVHAWPVLGTGFGIGIYRRPIPPSSTPAVIIATTSLPPPRSSTIGQFTLPWPCLNSPLSVLVYYPVLALVRFLESCRRASVCLWCIVFCLGPSQRLFFTSTLSRPSGQRITVQFTSRDPKFTISSQNILSTFVRLDLLRLFTTLRGCRSSVAIAISKSAPESLCS
jgi:hypothetical protein